MTDAWGAIVDATELASKAPTRKRKEYAERIWAAFRLGMRFQRTGGAIMKTDPLTKDELDKLLAGQRKRDAEQAKGLPEDRQEETHGKDIPKT